MNKYGSKEKYIEVSTAFSTYAVLTPDGEWHEPGEMGWWGISHASDEEEKKYKMWYEAGWLRQMCYAVSKDAMMPGDILCFANAGGTGYIGHVGIYVGDNKMIHAPQTGDVVKISSLSESYYEREYAGAKRVA